MPLYQIRGQSAHLQTRYVRTKKTRRRGGGVPNAFVCIRGEGESLVDIRQNMTKVKNNKILEILYTKD